MIYKKPEINILAFDMLPRSVILTASVTSYDPTYAAYQTNNQILTIDGASAATTIKAQKILDLN